MEHQTRHRSVQQTVTINVAQKQTKTRTFIFLIAIFQVSNIVDTKASGGSMLEPGGVTVAFPYFGLAPPPQLILILLTREAMLLRCIRQNFAIFDSLSLTI